MRCARTGRTARSFRFIRYPTSARVVNGLPLGVAPGLVYVVNRWSFMGAVPRFARHIEPWIRCACVADWVAGCIAGHIVLTIGWQNPARERILLVPP